jgi:hypothetical protein
MKVFDKNGLRELLGIGDSAAYNILRRYGFRIGYAEHSPMRITEDGIQKWIADQRKEGDKNCESV